MSITLKIVSKTPSDVDAIGFGVGSEGAVPKAVGLNRKVLAANGFDGKPGQTLTLPSAHGPAVIVVGIGEQKTRTATTLRDATASLVRTASKYTTLATNLASVDGVKTKAAAQAVAEGALLGTYRYDGLKTAKLDGSKLTELSIVASSADMQAVAEAVAIGETVANATRLARDLSNTPPAYMTATKLAETAIEVAGRTGLAVEVIDNDKAAELGLGGILGVNQGSVEPMRMVKLTYSPARARGHVALIGKGVTYDSGGISLKPSDGMHAMMKMDMMGAAVVLSVMSTLSSLGVRTKVTAYLCCTDNLPSGSAFKLGDVLTIRNGKTVEILNTDAEGRLVMADGLSLAAEEKPDALVDIATLTGAVMGALGQKVAGVLGNNQSWIDQVTASSKRTNEKVWQLPLQREYRKLLDSSVADMKNVGGPYGGAILAALFLDEFTDGIPWAHLDIAGTMNSDTDDGATSRGATAFGTRLLIDLIVNFTNPTADKS